MRRVDEVDIAVTERTTEVVPQGVPIGKALEERRGIEVVCRNGGIVNRNLRADAALRKKGFAPFQILRRAANLLAHAVGSSAGGEERTVRQLMPVRVRAEEPEKIGFRTHEKGEHRVGIAVSHGARAVFRKLTAVPTDLRLGHPERRGFDGAEEIIRKG